MTQFRSPTVIAAFLSLDRPELLYTVKDVSRGMAEPTHGDWHRLKSISRFLLMHLRLAQKISVATGPADALDRARQRLRGLRSDEEEHVRLQGTTGKTLCQRQERDLIGDYDFDGWSRILLVMFCCVTGHWIEVPIAGLGRNRGDQDSSGRIGRKGDSKQKRTGTCKARTCLWVQSLVQEGSIASTKIPGEEK